MDVAAAESGRCAGPLLAGLGSAGEHFVDGVHHGGAGHCRAAHAVDIAAKRHTAALADELPGEVFLRALLPDAGRLRIRVHRDRRDRAGSVKLQGHGHIRIAETGLRRRHDRRGRGILLFGGLGGRALMVRQIIRHHPVDRLHNGRAGDRRAGYGVDILPKRQGSALADELALERVLHAQLAETRGLIVGVDGDLTDRTVFVEFQAHRDILARESLRLPGHAAFDSLERERFADNHCSRRAQRRHFRLRDLSVLHLIGQRHIPVKAFRGLDDQGSVFLILKDQGCRILVQRDRCGQRAVDRLDDRGGCHRRAAQGVNILAHRKRKLFAAELCKEAFIRRAALTVAICLAAHVKRRDPGDRFVAGVDPDLYGDLASAESDRCPFACFHHALGSVDRIDHGLGRHGGSAEHVDAVADRDGLADELRLETFIRSAALTVAFSLGGYVEREGLNGAAVGIQDHGGRHVTAAETGRVSHAYVRVGGRAVSSALTGDIILLVKKGHGCRLTGDQLIRYFFSFTDFGRFSVSPIFPEGRLADEAKRAVDRFPHRARSQGSAGEGIKRSAFHRAQAQQLRDVVFGEPALAEAVRLLEIAVADLSADHAALGIQAQDDGHRAGVALVARLYAVADHLAALVLHHGIVGHAGIRRVIGDLTGSESEGLAFLLCGHDRGERLSQLPRLVLADRSLRHGVRHAEDGCGHHRDDRQDGECREQMLPHLLVCH